MGGDPFYAKTGPNLEFLIQIPCRWILSNSLAPVAAFVECGRDLTPTAPSETAMFSLILDRLLVVTTTFSRTSFLGQDLYVQKACFRLISEAGLDIPRFHPACIRTSDRMIYLVVVIDVPLCRPLDDHLVRPRACPRFEVMLWWVMRDIDFMLYVGVMKAT